MANEGLGLLSLSFDWTMICEYIVLYIFKLGLSLPNCSRWRESLVDAISNSHEFYGWIPTLYRSLPRTILQQHLERSQLSFSLATDVLSVRLLLLLSFTKC